MKEFINPLNIDAINNDGVSIGDDLALYPFRTKWGTYPIHEPKKLTNAVIAICTAGHCRLKVNLEEYA